MPNIPSWGAQTPNISNIPFVIAFPRKDKKHFLIDCGLSQYSYGVLDDYNMLNKNLPYPGGYNIYGELTQKPQEILDSWRALPIGLWKGSGYSFLLDVLGAALAQGNSACEIGRTVKSLGAEIAVTQIFIAFDLKNICNDSFVDNMIDRVAKDFKKALPAIEGEPFYYPGEKIILHRERNLKEGIPVNSVIWDEIKLM